MKQNYQEYKYTTIRFGKHKGKFMNEVPTEYIKWAIMNLTDQASAEMFAIELQRRDKSFRK
jgi:uncharacterized protein (DUF3820 family)